MERFAAHIGIAFFASAVAAGAAAQNARSAVYLDTRDIAKLLSEYREGNADAAVAVLAEWTEQEVDRGGRLPRGSGDDAWSRAALALLHMEATRQAATIGTVRTDVRILTRARKDSEPRGLLASGLMREVAAEAGKAQDPRLIEFCRLWQATFGGPHTQGVTDEARVFLGRGLNYEYWMGPEITGGGIEFDPRLDEPALTGTSHGRFSPRQFGAAETAYRQALASDAGLAEARVHLGRISYLLNLTDQARRELVQAYDDAQARKDVFSGYLAALFLGRLYEDRGDVDLAAAEYRKALRVHPGGQGARLSLGRLTILSGQNAEGWSIIREMLNSEPSAAGDPLDPWYGYSSLEREPWWMSQRIAQLRALIRR